MRALAVGRKLYQIIGIGVNKLDKKVSVIIPVYNTEKYLKRCVDSVINQTYSDLEIILIDDGSTDRSGIICDEYTSKDNRVKVVHKKNEGQAIARNYALDIMTGEFVAFVDSDDYIKPDMIYTMVESLVENECDVCICGKIYKYEDKIERKHTFVRNKVVGNTDMLMKKYFSHNISVVMWDKVYSSKVFDDLRFPPLRCREDSCILHEVLARCKKFVELPDCFYIQNIRENSTERKPFSVEKLECALEALNRRRNFAMKNFPQYYHFVKPCLVYLYYETLQEIVQKNRVKKNDVLYIEILNCLKKELSNLVLDDMKCDDVAKIKKIYRLVQSGYLLDLEIYKQSLIYKTKKLIKKLINMF